MNLNRHCRASGFIYFLGYMLGLFIVAYLMTGSVLVGGAIALVEPAVNTIAYHFHEQVWNRVQKARRSTPYQIAQTA